MANVDPKVDPKDDPVRTWADLRGIKFEFLQHSNQDYSHIHDVLNASHSQVITGADYTSLFPSPEMTALENNCAKLLLDAIFELIRARDVVTAPEYLNFIISGMKTNLPMTFTDEDDIRKYIHPSLLWSWSSPKQNVLSDARHFFLIIAYFF